MALADARDWVLVCGGFHAEGGMDRANLALARHLLAAGARLHLVAHRVDPELAATPGVTTAIVARPAGSYLAGELGLERRAHRVAEALRRQGRRLTMVANGGNAAGADINWVHSVHAAWPCCDDEAPAWFKAKNRATKAWMRRRERRALDGPRVVIANSARTRRDLAAIGVPEERIHTAYLGSDPEWTPPSLSDRASARAAWCTDPRRPLVVFVGALGHDANKGFDTLLRAWPRATSGWEAELVAAGGGATDHWRRIAQRAGEGVRVVGHTTDVGRLLAAADVIVSPVRYEAYGLAVHEAVCRGVPAIVSASAGVAERFTPAVAGLLLNDPGDADVLAAKIREWREGIPEWRDRFAAVGRELRSRTWDDMAADIVRLGERQAAPASISAVPVSLS